MPKIEASDRFQGLCLQSCPGSEFMVNYDHLPPQVRARSSSSPFNLCAACIEDIAARLADTDNVRWHPQSRHYLAAIESMENMIRCEEVNGEPI